MQHITFEGIHFEIGFHWGSLLAKRWHIYFRTHPLPSYRRARSLCGALSPGLPGVFPANFRGNPRDCFRTGLFCLIPTGSFIQHVRPAPRLPLFLLCGVQ